MQSGLSKVRPWLQSLLTGAANASKLHKSWNHISVSWPAYRNNQKCLRSLQRLPKMGRTSVPPHGRAHLYRHPRLLPALRWSDSPHLRQNQALRSPRRSRPAPSAPANLAHTLHKLKRLLSRLQRALGAVQEPSPNTLDICISCVPKISGDGSFFPSTMPSISMWISFGSFLLATRKALLRGRLLVVHGCIVAHLFGQAPHHGFGNLGGTATSSGTQPQAACCMAG